MKKLLRPLKVHIRRSTEKEVSEDANLLGLFALLYQMDVENKERTRATEKSIILTKKADGTAD